MIIPASKLLASRGISKEAVERVARIYHTNTDAAKALGIASTSFSRLGKKYGIPPPSKPRTAKKPAKKKPHPWKRHDYLGNPVKTERLYRR